MAYEYIGQVSLKNLDTHAILRDIAQRIADNRRLIITVGLPQSGKSMFIVSLLAYAFRSNDASCRFSIDKQEMDDVDGYLSYIGNNEVLPVTGSSTISLFDINMKSRYNKQEVRVTLLDIAGEDIKRLIDPEMPDPEDVRPKIDAILNACIAQRAIFTILTPVNANDAWEDNRLGRFMNALLVHNRRLYQLTKFLFVVSQWDRLEDKMSPAQYIREHRPQLYREYIANRRHGLLPFTVGNVVGRTILNVDLRSPRQFWFTLYRWCTGKHVLPWWKRLFG